MKLSEYNISSLIQKLDGFGEALSSVSYDIVDELVDIGKQQAELFNNDAPKSGEQASTIDVEKAKIIEGKAIGSVYMQGDSAVYDEFGTGEEGLSDPHPIKGNFNLNPYNSGPTIQINPETGRHYWYYKPMEGRPYYNFPTQPDGYTEGIPSGKQMYKTLQHLREVKKNVAIKNTNKAIGEINRVLKGFK